MAPVSVVLMPFLPHEPAMKPSLVIEIKPNIEEDYAEEDLEKASKNLNGYLQEFRASNVFEIPGRSEPNQKEILKAHIYMRA